MKDKLHLKHLLHRIEQEWSRKPMKPSALKKVKRYLQGMEKPNPKTLDKLSLFAGFQDWDSLKATLNGETDGLVNYEDPRESTRNRPPRR